MGGLFMPGTLIKIAQSDLRMANFAISTGDECDLRMAAYHIQQAVEKALKQILEDYGVSYTKTHKLYRLSALLPDSQAVLSRDLLALLKPGLYVLTVWESESRYNTEFAASREEVLEMFSLAQAVLEAYALFEKQKQEIELNAACVKLSETDLFHD